MSSNNLCIIPARGGSKRIPRKNIKDFLGKPIIAYSIEAALDCGLFDEVMVSTDDDEIADVATSYGATVPFFRSNRNSDDYATTFDVIREVLESYKIDLDKEFDFACCIYAPAPFINGDLLNVAYSRLIEKNFDTVFPVMRYGFPIQRALNMNNEGALSFINPENALLRSQDLEASFHDAGQFYWFRVDVVLMAGLLITDNVGAIEITEIQGQDIDNEVDWKLAEVKYELLQSTK